MAITAFVFPGQGSQVVGMGRDLADAFPTARQVFTEADAVLGFPLSHLCFNGPVETLTDTYNQQPALLTTSVAVLRLLTERGWSPQIVAGHSLGEYSALVAAGALAFPDALRLVRERGRVMKLAGETHAGSMAAVIGMETANLEAICREVSQSGGGLGVVCANYNAPGQIVISGEKEAVAAVGELAKARGAKRVIPLAVSIASHSPLMAGAAREFAGAVAKTPVQDAAIPVVLNATGKPAQTAGDIRTEMVTQLTSPVRWTDSVQGMVAAGVTRFIEVGPKDVLAGLIRRIAPDVTTISVGDVKSLEALS